MSLSGHMPPPSLVRNINYSGNFYLRVGQSSCSCFVSLIFLIFSFHLSLALCIKTHTKTQEMALKRLYFSKFFRGACPQTSLEVLAASARVGQIRVYPPPKFLSPYAYVVRHVLKQAIIYKLYSPSSHIPLVYYTFHAPNCQNPAPIPRQTRRVEMVL